MTAHPGLLRHGWLPCQFLISPVDVLAVFSPSIQDAADGAVVNVHFLGERSAGLVGLRVVKPQDVRDGGRFGRRVGDFPEAAGPFEKVGHISRVRRDRRLRLLGVARLPIC